MLKRALMLPGLLSFYAWSQEVQLPGEVDVVNYRGGKSEVLRSVRSFKLEPQHAALVSLSPKAVPVLFLSVPEGSVFTFERVPDSLSTDRVQEALFQSRLSDLMVEVYTVQAKLRKKDLVGADNRLSALEKSYPELHFLKFVRASYLYLQGNKEAAKNLTQEALKRHPDFPEGSEFLKGISR